MSVRCFARAQLESIHGATPALIKRNLPRCIRIISKTETDLILGAKKRFEDKTDALQTFNPFKNASALGSYRQPGTSV